MQDAAVKKPRIADDTDVERVLGLAIREAELLAELSHPNIVCFEGFIEDITKNIIWLVFRWAPNGSLKDFVGVLDWKIPERIWLFNDVAQGLAYLHSRRPPICHGDLKSINVLVDENCRAVITDLGSARRLQQQDPKPRTEQAECQTLSAQPPNATFCASTMTITLTGNKYTLRWAAPELLLEDQQSLWSDIWALGWIAYEVMTGFLPFQDATKDIAVVEHVIGGKLPSLTNNADLSAMKDLCMLMNFCWKTTPTQRPTADYLRDSVERMPMLAPALDTSQPGSPGDGTFAVKRLHMLGHVYQSRGEYSKAHENFAEALESSRLRNDAEELQSSLHALARVYRDRGKYDKAISLYSEASEICTELSDRNGRVSALWALAEVRFLQGRSDEAIPLYSDVLRFFTNIGDGKTGVSALFTLAEEHRRRGEKDKAILRYCEASRMCANLNDRSSKASVLWACAEVRRLQGKPKEAIPLYHSALKVFAENDGNGRISASWGLAAAPRLDDTSENATLLQSEAKGVCTEISNGRYRAPALLTHAHLHRLRGEYDQAISLYSEASRIYISLNHTEGGDAALWDLDDIYRLQAEYNTVIPQSEALKIFSKVDGTNGRVSSLLTSADVHRLRGEYKKAMSLYSEALKIFTDFDDKNGIASTLLTLAHLHRLRGEYNKAIPLYCEAFEICTKLDDRRGRASVLWALAEVHRLQGEYTKAIPLYSQASKLFVKSGDKKGRVSALLGLAEVHQLQCDYNKAITLYSEVLKIHSDLGDRKSDLEALWGLAEIHWLRGEVGKAMSLYSQASGVRKRLGDREGEVKALCGLVEVHRLRGEYDKAIPLYSDALKIPAKAGSRDGEVSALLALAHLHRLRGEYDKAIPLYSDALKLFDSTGDKRDKARALWGLAEGHRFRGEYDKATTLYGWALCVFTKIGDGTGRASALLGLAEIHRLQGQYEKAILRYSETLKAHTGPGYGKEQVKLPWDPDRDYWPRAKSYEANSHSRALKILDDLGDRKRRASDLWYAAEIHRRHGEYDKAIPLSSEILGIWTELGDKEGRASALLGLAHLHRLQRENDKAIQLYSEASEVCTKLGNRQGRVAALLTVAHLHRISHNYNKAILLYSEASEICNDLNDRNGRAAALIALAEVHRLQCEYDRTIPLYSEASTVCTDLDNRNGRASALLGFAEVHRVRGDYNKAIPLYSEVLKIYTDLDNREGKVEGLWGLAEAHRLRGAYDKAIPLYSDVIEIHRNLGNRSCEVEALWYIDDDSHLRANYDKAISHSEALKIFTDLRDNNNIVLASLPLARLRSLRGRSNKAVPLDPTILKVHTDPSDWTAGFEPPSDSNDDSRPRVKSNKAISHSKASKVSTDTRYNNRRILSPLPLAPLSRLHPRSDKAILSNPIIPKVPPSIGNQTGEFEPPRDPDDDSRLQTQNRKAISHSEASGISTVVGDKNRRVFPRASLSPLLRFRAGSDKAIPLDQTIQKVRPGLGDRKGEFKPPQNPDDDSQLRTQNKKTISHPEASAIATNVSDSNRRGFPWVPLAPLPRLHPRSDKVIPSNPTIPKVPPSIGNRKGVFEPPRDPDDDSRLRTQKRKSISHSEASIISTDVGGNNRRVLPPLPLAPLLRAGSNKATPSNPTIPDVRPSVGNGKGEFEPPRDLDDDYMLRAMYHKPIVQPKGLDLSKRTPFAFKELAAAQRRREREALDLSTLAHRHMIRREYDQAIPLYTEASELLAGPANQTGKASVLLKIAHALRLQRKYDEAIAFYWQVLEIRTALGNQKGRVVALLGLADVHRAQSSWTIAAGYYSQVAEISKQFGNKELIAVALKGAATARKSLQRQTMAENLAKDTPE